MRELAALCLEAMDEKNYDLRGLPGDVSDAALPTVHWDCDNPAQALDSLVQQFNCRVVHRPVANDVLIASMGNGATPPESAFSDFSPAFDSPVRPKKLRLFGAPAAFLCPVVLEAVGEDLDGSIVPLDDLSYKPTAGWSKSTPTFISKNSLVLAEKYRARGFTGNDVETAARKSLYRFYRVTVNPVTGKKFTVPGLDAFFASLGEVPPDFTSYRQIVPLPMAVGVGRDENRKLYADPPKVYGVHTNGQLALAFAAANTGNTEADARVTWRFSVDSARGLVIFEAPVYRVNIGRVDLPLTLPFGFGGITVRPGEYGPAEIVLLTSIYIRDGLTNQVVRFWKDREVGGRTIAEPADPSTTLKPRAS